MSVMPDVIIGHEKQREQLLLDMQSKNVAHAYLFCGPRHVGKFSMAKWFAWQLLSEGLSEEGKIKTRRQIEKLTHPDFLSLDALWMAEKQESWEQIAESSNVDQTHRSKKKVRTDMIGIDDIRALQERLHETASSKYVCCLIRSIERMQDPAANAFLKILEEPPPRVVFLLTTQTQQALLPTLQSRARIILFSSVASKEMTLLLSHLSDEESIFIRHLAQGAPGKAVRLIRDADALLEEKKLHAQATRFWQSQLHERLQWLATYQDSGREWDPMLLHLGLTLREINRKNGSSRWHRAYADLLSDSKTNAHKGLLLSRFALAVSRD